MKRICLIGCMIGILFFSGCGGRIGKDVTINGLDVSRMSMAKAHAAVTAADAARIEQTVFLLRAGDQLVKLSASALGVRAAAGETVERAAAVNRRDSGRTFHTRWAVDEATLDEAVRALGAAFDAPASDAAVQIDFTAAEPFVYTTETCGRRVDSAALKSFLLAAIEKKASCEIAVPFISVPAAVTLADVQGSRQLVATFTTSFHKSPQNNENRVFNIVKAARLIHGTVLQPGETFDCNAVLGDRNEKNGWKEAPGIVNGAYVPEYGGGVCQVSSTLFNAVMMADLEIIERSPHSWPMSYVGIGRDATISTGGKNFRFVNSSEAPIYLVAFASANDMTLTVSIYGAPLPNGQSIKITSECIGTTPAPSALIQLDESLPAETRVVERESRQGKTSRTYKNYYNAGGNLLSRAVAYEDVYRPIEGLTYVSADLYYS